MTADLPPDVRARVAEFLALAEKSGQLGAGSGIFTGRLAYWRAVVDAVTAVVAPEISRPLQARIEELEDRELRLQDQAGEMAEELIHYERDFIADRKALQARIEELERALRELFAAGDDTTAEEGEAIRARALAVLAKGEKP